MKVISIPGLMDQIKSPQIKEFQETKLNLDIISCGNIYLFQTGQKVNRM